MKRHSFIASGVSAASIAAIAVPPSTATPQPSLRSGRSALILIGGANRGAYQAGVIQAVVEAQGVSDGQALDFDMVSGTSIGALNAYLVATAQYSALKEVWYSGVIASRNLFRLKSPFNMLQSPDAGVLNRLDAAYRLGTGLTRNVTGILNPEPINTMLHDYVDTKAVVHLPLYVSTTNLTAQQLQVFVLRATSPDGIAKQNVNDQLLSDDPFVRPITDDIIHRVFFATAALPVLFDPILIPRTDDPSKLEQYCDGGVTENLPFDAAQRCVDTLKVIVVDPPRPDISETYDNALEVCLGIFATMQFRILEFQVRLAYALNETTLPINPYLIRPQKSLPGKYTNFNQQSYLTWMWERGYADGKAGWQKFVPSAQLLPG